MSRSERLLRLIEILRCHRYPVSGKKLAEELKISLRTLYRDIATLQSQGAEIDGEAGVGYVLKRGFTLPPLMFTADEIEALVLDSRFVISRTDNPLSESARSALAKIAAVLPQSMAELCDKTTLMMAPPFMTPSLNKLDKTWGLPLRQAIRDELKVTIKYRDLAEKITDRTIWPFGIAFFDRVQVVLAYCEKRQAFRHFRLDRIISLEPTGTRYAKPRRYLMKEWRESLGTDANHQILLCNN